MRAVGRGTVLAAPQLWVTPRYPALGGSLQLHCRAELLVSTWQDHHPVTLQLAGPAGARQQTDTPTIKYLLTFIFCPTPLACSSSSG